MRHQRSGSSSRRGAPPVGALWPGLLALAGLLALPLPAAAQSDGGKVLDAKYCGDALNLNPGSTYDNGSCQLWRLVPDADGWARLQLKRNGKFLDAKYCSDQLNMNPGSTYDNGSCQLWRFVPAGGGWSRLQIKRNGKFLDADNCSDNVKLNGELTYDDGACQLWRLVPADGGWSKLQIKFTGGPAPAAQDDQEFVTTARPTTGTTTAGAARAFMSSASNFVPARVLAAARAGMAGAITATIMTTP